MIQGNIAQAAIVAAVPAGKYTVLTVSEMMALTSKAEIEVVEVQAKESYAQYRHLTMLVFKQRGKRKLVGKYVRRHDLILRGWNLGLVTDMEDTSNDNGTGCRTFSGNALINLRGDVDEIRAKIEGAFAYGEAAKGICIVKRPDGVEVPVFPSEAANAAPHHAVLRNVLEALEPKEDLPAFDPYQPREYNDAEGVETMAMQG